ncbi:restriction endonuclease subunit S [Acinetobacter seifertii]|nr:restriction endonuclease subunit S [Acinetobacter seifertii]MBJ9424006.1 restriction endonuclease subunit S [Acinetobacter seifertii]
MATPKLRFKAFNDDWSLKTIGEIASKVGSGSTPRGGAEAYTNEGVIFIRSQNVNNNQLLLDDVVFIPEATHKKMSGSKVQANDILLNITGASIGRSCVVSTTFVEGNVNQHVCIIRTPNHNPIFVQSFLSSEKGQNHIQAKQVGGGREGLNFQAIRSIDFEIPSKEEQTKIASFLSTVDEKISQLTQKHELLSQYKQGMMQKLFSQQIRFKADDGSEFGEWETDLIRDVFTNKSKNYNPQIGKNLPCIELEHLSQNTGKILGTIESCEQQSTKNLFEKNSVLFGKLRPYLRKFAKPQFKGVCSSEIWVLTGLKISNEYLFQYIQSEHFSELTNIQSGSKMPRADWNVISEAEIEYPCIAEQTKIANFLASIDQKIEVVAKQIEQAKQWKKGLLQQMFV